MNQQAHNTRPNGRSSFIRKPLALFAAGLLLSVAALPAAAAANWWTATPQISIGSATVNIRDRGAKGDGVTNDTVAIQASINSLPRDTGGTVFVPAGKYMIDTVHTVSLRSNIHLKLDPMAELAAMPSSATRYYMIKVWNSTNVEISGGKITGERTRHIGSTGEWGYGVSVLGSSKVFVHDIKLSNSWGDGIFVGATGSGSRLRPSSDITLNRVVADNNRRQGLSVGPAERVFVYNSTFSNSNGAAPQSGIDIEPQADGPANLIRIENSVLSGNMGSGLELCAYSSNIVVKKTTIRNNNGFGILATNSSNAWLANNLITENGLDGVALAKSTHDYKITNSMVNYNSTRWFTDRDLPITMKTNSTRDLDVGSATYRVTLSGITLSPTL